MFFWEKIAEEKIKQAIQNGEFDNLPGQGQSIYLSDYFKLPPGQRMAIDILKKNNAAPREVQLLQQIKKLRDDLEAEKETMKSAIIKKQLSDKETEYNILLERNRIRKTV